MRDDAAIEFFLSTIHPIVFDR